jgi:hypothetical protein
MPNDTAVLHNVACLASAALSKWENEGGAAPGGPWEGTNSQRKHRSEPPCTQEEFTRLRARVIALESLVAALLAQGTDRQLGRARGVAAYIAPRSGITRHPLTVRAAARIVQLVARASHLRDRGH